MDRPSSLQVWITRARPGAEHTAHKLEALGYRSLLAPVLKVEPLGGVQLPQDAPAALAFTSANAVRAFASLSGDRAPPVFAVGDATAKVAHELGFGHVRSADGDVRDLARLILEHRDSVVGPVLHPCALEPAGDLAGPLRACGVAATALPIYRTCASDRLAPSVASALQAGDVEAVLIHSPKAARVVQALVAPPPYSAQIERAACLALSRACAQPLAETPFRAVYVAKTPTENDLLQELVSLDPAPWRS